MAITHGKYPEYSFILSSFLPVSLLYRAFSRMIFFPKLLQPDHWKQWAGMHAVHLERWEVGKELTTFTTIRKGQGGVWLVIHSFTYLLYSALWWLELFQTAGCSGPAHHSAFSIPLLSPCPNFLEGKGEEYILYSVESYFMPDTLLWSCQKMSQNFSQYSWLVYQVWDYN